MDGYEQPDGVKDCHNFLKLMDELKPYTVEFEKDGTMKPKKYLSDCAIRGKKRQPIIVIIHDKFTFSPDDCVQRTWTQIGDTFLRPKR